MIRLDVWLYGPLARYAPRESEGSHAHVTLSVPEGTRMSDLLDRLGIPPEEKGITFVNAQLSDMPDLGADRDMELKDGDRIGILHRRTMWPFQYRFGAATTPEFRDATLSREGGALHHSTARVEASDNGKEGTASKTEDE